MLEEPIKLRSLGRLSDPRFLTEPLDLRGQEPSRLRECLERMLLIRACEEKLADMKRDGKINGPVHLGIGQEAIAVGVSGSLRSTDRVFGTHRSHSHALALGMSVRSLFAEVAARADGASRGMGGSMHLWDAPNGFFGSVPIVAGTVSLAVGAALAARMDGTGDVAVAYFGDGACEEGVVHESLNIAAVLRVPVLFVVENNLFSSHLHVSLRQPSDCMARFADAHGIASKVVDGNDVVAVSHAAAELVDSARRDNRPGFLEAATYRWRGHVDWREDIDVGVNRSAEDLAHWKKRDPVRRLTDALIASGTLDAAAVESIKSRIAATVASAWTAATNGVLPDPAALVDYVYAPPR